MDKLQWIQNKHHTTDSIARLCNVWRATGNKIVFTNGCFDILHRGHLELLIQAADWGNKLVVGINADASVKRLKGAERPLNHESDRLFQLASLLCVDAVCLFEEDTPAALIELVKPDVLVKGGDYHMGNIVGADFVKSYGGRVAIVPFRQGYSTSGLIDRIRNL
jgi:rfaE bifunctional protein nucleotidyltransferase chain/domain